MQSIGNIGKLLTRQFENTNYLPQKIELEDIGLAYRKFLEDSGFSLLTETGIVRSVPVIYVNQEMWAERKINWKAMRNERGEEVTRPFIALSRKGVEKGTAPLKFTVPNKKKFTFVRVPVFDGTLKGIDIYKIPQPTYVDITFEVRFVSHYMEDVDSFYQIMIDKLYSSQQAYINVNGYYIATKMEKPSEENNVDDFSAERVYQIIFPIIAHGKLIDPTQFERVNTIKKISIKISEQ